MPDPVHMHVYFTQICWLDIVDQQHNSANLEMTGTFLWWTFLVLNLLIFFQFLNEIMRLKILFLPFLQIPLFLPFSEIKEEKG